MESPWLSDDEIMDLCAGLTQPAAQIRFILRLGYAVRQKPNGRPLVMRSDMQSSKPTQEKPRAPNRTALVAHFRKAA